jgi:hypothetical protein
MLISIMVVIIYIPTNSAWGFSWLRWDGISVMFWFAFLPWLKMLNISSCICYPFVPLRTVCSIHLLLTWHLFSVLRYWSHLFFKRKKRRNAGKREDQEPLYLEVIARWLCWEWSQPVVVSLYTSRLSKSTVSG